MSFKFIIYKTLLDAKCQNKINRECFKFYKTTLMLFHYRLIVKVSGIFPIKEKVGKCRLNFQATVYNEECMTYV